jgi:hypothetical protein
VCVCFYVVWSCRLDYAHVDRGWWTWFRIRIGACLLGAGGLVEVEDIFIVLAKRKGVDRWFFGISQG